MSPWVIDASATLGWLFAEPGAAGLPGDLFGIELVAPWLWRTECVNGILVAERRQRITQAQGCRYLQILDSLEVSVIGEPTMRTLESLALLARPHQLTAYDALYLELAVSMGVPICSLDQGLQRAARAVGVEVVGAASR